MKTTDLASLVFANLARVTSITPRSYESNLNLNECRPAGQRAEENFSSLINGYHTDDNVPLVEDQSVNQTEAVEFLLLNHSEEFVAVMHQALYTARILEKAYEEMGELDKADVAHACRRELVKANLAYFSSDLING
jgi:hypothetical protein